MKVLRPAFDDACVRVDIPVNLRDPLWEALASSGAAPVKAILSGTPMPRWSLESRPLLESIRRERATLRQHAATGSILSRYSGLTVLVKGKPYVVTTVYRLYCERFEQIARHIEQVLRLEGHYCVGMPEETLDIITANLRAAGQFAGTLNWTQWEDPRVIRKTCAIFDEARSQQLSPGRSWVPFHTHASARGAASHASRTAEWRTAMARAVTHVGTLPTPYNGDGIIDGPAPLLALRAYLGTPEVQAIIEEAIARQVRERRTPGNREFTPNATNPRRNVWRILDKLILRQLASRYHEALLACDYDPVRVHNMFET